MVKYFTDQTLVLGRVEGVSAGYDSELDLPEDRLRFENGQIVDVTNRAEFFIDPDGNKQSQNLEDWQELSCRWDDLLSQKDGLWQVHNQTAALIKAHVSKLIYQQVDPVTQNNLSAELGLLSVKKPADWQQRSADIADILLWIQAMVATSRALISENATDYALASKWPVFPERLQVIVNEM